MGDDDTEDLIFVGCPECGTFREYEEEEQAQETVDSHNDRAHDGEEVAEVGRQSLKVSKMQDLSEEQKMRLARNMMNR